MSGAWKAKRFWKEATVAVAPGGHTIHLDSRPVRTPAKTPLIVPTRALALGIAAEWDAQQGEVRPDTMPLTRTANSAIDKVAVQRTEVADLLAAYGESDLICYRALTPEKLVARQAVAWDPLLEWAEQALGARLGVGAGVMHVAQDKTATDRLARLVHELDSFQLAAFYDLVAISGSLVIALAVIRKKVTPEMAWKLSRIDEDWQVEQWGPDDEAEAVSAIKSRAFMTAARFFTLCSESA